jgi:hypothetical protein
MNPREIQFEKFWRNHILEEIEQLIRNVPEVNAQGIVIAMKEKINDL